MKIFISTHNRANIITTPALLDAEGISYTLVFHNVEQLNAYNLAGRFKTPYISVANIPVGMTLMRNWILENLVKDGEWFIILDDNITEFQAVRGEWYKQPELPSRKDPLTMKKVMEEKVSAKYFLGVLEDCRWEAERRGIHLAGCASNLNFFFRSKKWREVGYVIGKTQVIQKTGLRYDLNINPMDDYLWTALNLETFGKVLINNYAVAVKKHYAKGGIGTYEERLPAKLKDCEYLMKRFPGLFRYKVKKGCHPKAELQIRFTSNKQVEKWRAFMRSRKTT